MTRNKRTKDCKPSDYEEFQQWKIQKDRNIWINLGIEFFVFGLIILYWILERK